MQRHKLIVVAFTFLLLCCTRMVRGQELAATLNGTVTDSTGAVIPRATVSVAESGVNGSTRTVQTNAQGNYTVTNLAPGSYTVTVTADGFKTYAATDVTLFVAQTRTVGAKLQPGNFNQTVTVEQNAVAVDTTTSALAGTISGEQVRELQLNNRNFEQLVTLQPGVVSGLPDEVGFGLNNTTTVAVNGARATANKLDRGWIGYQRQRFERHATKCADH
jgi:Carboxypeptidase regulatory-like domain